MRIDRLDLIAYGHFAQRSIDLSAGPHRFHLICGPNESGKSTSLRAITSWLYGMSHRIEDDYRHNAKTLRVGGRLVDGDEALECVRRRGNKMTLRDAADDQAIDETVLPRMLGGIDEAAFRSRFGLTHDELVTGGSQILSGQGELGEILFAAGAGLGRLRNVLDDLQREMAELFKKGNGKSAIVDEIKKVASLRQEVTQAQVQPAVYDALRSKLADQKAVIASLSQTVQSQSTELNQLQIRVQAIPLAQRFNRVCAELDAMPDLPTLAEDFSNRRRQWDQDQKMESARLAEWTKRRDHLREQIKRIGDDPEVRLRQDEIEELAREMISRKRAERELQEYAKSLEQVNKNIQTHLKTLAIKTDSIHVSNAAKTRIQKLATQYEKVRQLVDESESEIAKLRLRMDRVNEQLANAVESADPDVLTKTIEEIGPPERLIEAVDLKLAQREKLRLACESEHRGMKIDSTLEQTCQLVPPDTAVIAELTRRWDESRDAAESQRKQHETLAKEFAAAEDELRGDVEQRDLPTVTDLQDARKARNALLDQWDTDDVPGQLTALKFAIDRADTIADQLNDHQEAVQRRASAVAALATMKRKLTRLEAEVQQADQEWADAQTRWRTEWERFRIPPQPPAAMVRWLASLTHLVERNGQLQQAAEEHAQAVAAMARAIDRLRLSTRVTEPSDTSNTMEGSHANELRRLHDEVMACRNDSAAARKERQSLLAQKQQWESDLVDATAKHAERIVALEKWRADWRERTHAFTEGRDVDATDVLDMLDELKELESLHAQRDQLTAKMNAIADETKLVCERVLQLASLDSPAHRFSDEVDPLETAAAVVDRLHARLQAERSKRQSRSDLTEQLRQVEDDLASCQETHVGLEVIRHQLCQEARCDDPERFAELETLCHQRDVKQAEKKQLQDQLIELARGESLEAFVDTLADVSVADLDSRIETLKIQKPETEKQLAASNQSLGALQNEFDKIDGSGKASERMQSMQFGLGRIQRDSRTYIRLKLGEAILKQAIEHYRDDNQGPVLKEAEAIFVKLTCGEYRQLKIDYDDKGTPFLQGVRGSQTVPAPAMSTGTADALYLAIRLASLKHHISQSKPIPFIIDDCLVQLDDARAAAALQVFSDLSLSTQVILFTHHQHLVELAHANLPEAGFRHHAL